MKKGIIFDLDGTLWDSAKGVVDAWNEVIDSIPDKDHLITMEEMYQLMGKPMDEIAALVFPNMSVERREEVMEICCKKENDLLRKTGGILFPELEETLIELKKNYELFIVSNCQVGYIEAFLEHYGFHKYFTDTENFGNTGRLKAYNIDLVVKRNGLNKAVYVGDTQGDCDSSKEAGIPFVFASYGFGNVNHKEYEIGSFKELVELLPTII